MHLRYDFKTKPDLSNFKTQSKFFLKKEDCVFSFYLEDFAVTFEVNKNEYLVVKQDGEVDDVKNWKVKFSILESSVQDKNTYRIVTPITDPKIQDITIISDFFNGSEFVCEKNSTEVVLIFVEYMLNCVRKLKRLSALA